MEDFLSTVVFLLPGFLMYFWIQAFGVNPVQKHSVIELTAISALLWLPVTVLTLVIYNYLLSFGQNEPIWSINEIQESAGNLFYLTGFLVTSVFVSFIVSSLWAKFIFPFQLWLINVIRKWRGVAKYSKTPSVWEEVFLQNDAQVVEVLSLSDNKKGIIGEIEKVSRPFETDRNLYLRHMDFYIDLVKRHEIPVEKTFIDSRTGMCVKIFNMEQIKIAQEIDLANDN